MNLLEKILGCVVVETDVAAMDFYGLNGALELSPVDCAGPNPIQPPCFYQLTVPEHSKIYGCTVLESCPTTAVNSSFIDRV